MVDFGPFPGRKLREFTFYLPMYAKLEWQKMRLAGDQHVYFFDSFVLYRDGSIHPTVEGLHPSDLGFRMIADALAPDMAKILGLPAP